MTQILQNGSEFGQYRVRLLLGRGGMGEVYEVEHRVLGTRHALKLLSDEVLNQEVVLDYFKNEGRVMAQLNHSGIVSVDEFGETDGHYWLRMELIEGVPTTSGTQLFTLHDYVWHQGGSLKEAEVAECMRQFLEAIGFAHERGVVHRDLKPTNILLDTEDGMKISDFGLVKVAAADWHRSRIARSHPSGIESPSSGVDLEASKPEVLGTFEYMSPEQKQGFADQRSDLYSVGLIGFQLLTGKERPSVKPPSRIVDGIHPNWDNWFELALENDPDERFQTAEEMRKAIPDIAKQPKPLNPKSRNKAVLPSPSSKTKVRDPDIEEDDFPSAPKPRKRRKRGQEERQQRSSFGAFLPWFIVLFLLGIVATGLIYLLINYGNPSRPTILDPEIDQNRDAGMALTPPSIGGGESPDSSEFVEPASTTGYPTEGKDWTLPGLGLKMKWQKAGAFRMGSDPDEAGHEEKEAPA
ncbi:MAG: serine/threonine protein kinase, partial [Opitutae bacterium]|nr:serine/threonine protein kinase [Opitutae bacterium]